MKTLLLLFVLSFISIGAFAQDFEVPKKPKLEKDKDFAAYQEDVLKCIDWLAETPLDEQASKRKEANQFLMLWLTGSPSVTIGLNEDIISFMNTSPELLTIFLGGWAKHSIESGQKDKVSGNLAGIEAVIKFYKANRKTIGKNKSVEKYIKMKEKGSLEAYVKEKA